MSRLKHLNLFLLILAAVLFPEYSVRAAGCAEPAGTNLNANLIVLSPGHSRTVFYELNDVVLNDINSVHAAVIMATGSGTLTVSAANTSPMDKGDEIIYAVTGFVGTTALSDYAYGSSPITMSIPLTASFVSFGLVFTAVIAKIGNPDFPVTMSMTFYLTPDS